MREFKFRAWSRLKKYMFEVNAMSQKAVEEMRDGMSFRYARAEVVLMQSTGLPDKNGVEIYGGDILRFSPPWADITWIDKVVWSNFFAGFALNSEGNDASMDADMVENCEVIGNVFENPELLEVER